MAEFCENKEGVLPLWKSLVELQRFANGEGFPLLPPFRNWFCEIGVPAGLSAPPALPPPFFGDGVPRLYGDGEGDGDKPLELWLSAEWSEPVDWWWFARLQMRKRKKIIHTAHLKLVIISCHACLSTWIFGKSNIYRAAKLEQKIYFSKLEEKILSLLLSSSCRLQPLFTGYFSVQVAMEYVLVVSSWQNKR